MAIAWAANSSRADDTSDLSHRSHNFGTLCRWTAPRLFRVELNPQAQGVLNLQQRFSNPIPQGVSGCAREQDDWTFMRTASSRLLTKARSSCAFP